MATNSDTSRQAPPGDVEAKKVNRPSDSRLKQQKLKAWQPILTAGTVLPTFFVIGIVFIPIGAVLLHSSNTVFELSYDYTNCNSSRPSESGQECQNITKYNTSADCHCHITFNIDQDIQNVYIYYGLTNFYQNHRRYVKSRDDKQLLGNVGNNYQPAPDCSPFQYFNETIPIAPCGAIANSFFNDSFVLLSKELKQIPLNYTGIAWPSDKSAKFKNPSNMNDFNLPTSAPPPGWKKRANQLSEELSENGFQNESFIVWMRISALPTFRKLHSRLDNTLAAGTYHVDIGYNYPVYEFDGKKRFIISTMSWAGGKNPFLGVAYIVVGCLCILTGAIFFFIHLKFGKSLTDMANIGR